MSPKWLQMSHSEVDRLLALFPKFNRDSVWCQVKVPEDFTFRPLLPGYSAELYCCSLTPEGSERLLGRTDDAESIVVKWTTSNAINTAERRLDYAIIWMIMSKEGISPRLLYVDETVAISEYIESRPFTASDEEDPETVGQLARLLARLHTSKPPISPTSYRSLVDIWKTNSAFADVLNYKYLAYLKDETDKNIYNKYYTPLAEVNFTRMNAEIEIILKAVQSPVVFSHFDFNQSNRLVRERHSADGSQPLKELFLIDFDYATYACRGFDLGRYFSYFALQEENSHGDAFPSDEKMAIFLGAYRDECARLLGGTSFLDDPVNSLEHLIREAKVYTLDAYRILFFALMKYVRDPNGEKREFFLESALIRYQAYKRTMKCLFQDGTIEALKREETNGG